MGFAVVIPTLNAAAFLDALIPAILAQTAQPDALLIIDSSSSDDTVARFAQAGATVHTIAQSDFDHGRTRRLAVDMLADADLIIMMTQDAIPASEDAFARLVDAFSDSQVAVAFGRQLPRRQASEIESFARQFNYPEQSYVRGFADRDRLGIRTMFCSNSFAAYRAKALRAIGGFPDAYFGEDQIVAGKLLIEGWRLAYQADAPVRHSHGYSIGEDFRRYFDIGVFHGSNPWIRQTFGGSHGEGVRFALAEARHLWRHAPHLVGSALLRSAAKFTAYHLGKRHEVLPTSLRARLSLQPAYWRRQAMRA